MKKRGLWIFFFTIIISLSSGYAYCQNSINVDYGGLNMARQCIKQNNYVLAYKYLIIFKYSNLQRLQTKENSENLTKLEKQINEIEAYLLENYSWVDEIKIRGFKDAQIDSTLQALRVHHKKIAVQNIEIN
ncbi:hypothetical protein [Mucilaginibacter ginsenosidivorans]|uniref:Uncharacterized protein n=1 Tax=Mucilaginibacter ginsenosidivorans TaxID=398053 RepID=A0A5B8UUR6_9SPHI|nr:hypothetical protein [Mucilaginibacter ginsenosidivorans]QEC62515.1 hypothetical protein FRZ54_07905 [Mucilaginibacter ginsenosidivorans]